MVNPYESPRGLRKHPPRITLWRTATTVASVLIALVMFLLACYGVYSLNSRGWPHTIPQTFVILTALTMFVIFGIGVASFGVGVARRRRSLITRGVLAMVVATMSYFLLYFAAN